MKMIVMDGHNTKMQATVRMDKLKRFQHHLKEGNALTIQRYSLGEIKQKFRMVYNAMRLSFLSNTEVDSCTDFNGSVHGFVWRPFKSITNLEKEENGEFGKMCIQNGYRGTKLHLFDGNKVIYEDEYKEVKEFRQRLFSNQPSEQSENTATKISTAFKNSTKDTFVNKHPIRNIAKLLDVEHVQTHCRVQSVIVGTVIARQEDEGWWYLRCRACRDKVIKSTDYIDLESKMPKKPDEPNDWWCRKCNAWIVLIKSQFRLQILVQDQTGTMSLSLFNDEVSAMASHSAYQLCEKYAKYAFKVAIDDHNVKKLLPVFTVLRFSNDQEIINFVLACATPIKILAWMKTIQPMQKKCRKELMSNREHASSKDKRSNPSVSSDAFLTCLSISSAHPQPIIRNRMPLSDITNCRVLQMQQQDTNVMTTLLPFGLNRSLTLGNSIVSQMPVLGNTTTNANHTQRLPNSTKSIATRGHVRRTSKQSTNLAISLLAFGNNKTPTMENSNVSQISVLCNTINLDNSSTLGRNSSPTRCNQVTPVDQACKRRSPLKYYDHGDPTFECKECHALLWEAKAKRGNPNLVNKAYGICCKKGKVMLEKPPATPKPLLDLFLNDDDKSQNFRNNIRTYNSINSFGSCGRSNSKHPIDRDIMYEVKDVLDTSSDLVKTFRRERAQYNEDSEQNIRIKLVAKRGRDGRTYNLPTSNEVVGLIVGDFKTCIEQRDTVIEKHREGLERINSFHPLYLPLQYPLLMLCGQDGYHLEIPHKKKYGEPATSKKDKTVSMREWFSYQIQDRTDQENLFTRRGRLF
nr:replication protein A 70 kDa DNA-binding subunit B [Tanacetum cinerariifolium]